MNFRDQLRAEASRANTDFIVHAIDGDQDHFDNLFALIYDTNGYIANRAAWVVEKCATVYPHLVTNYLEDIVDHLKETKFNGSKRCLLKVLTIYDLPESRKGEIVDMCFTWLASPKEKVALKVYSMHILSNICVTEPELIPEFLAVLETHYEHNSVAFQSRAKKIFKALQRYI